MKLKSSWHALFTYKDGDLYWKISPTPRIKIGTFAGYRSKSYGYQEIKYLQKEYRAHRIIWEMFNGFIPDKMEIDHIDGDGSNNNISNLRLVTHQENIKNQKLRVTTVTGITGVSKPKKTWCANIGVNGKNINLGCFAKKQDAINARKKAEVKYNFHPNHGRS